MTLQSANRKPTHKEEPERSVAGDPAIGALLADPLQADSVRDEPNPAAGRRTPDPAPPQHHGDWLPTAADKQAERQTGERGHA